MSDITESMLADTKPLTIDVPVCVDGELFRQRVKLESQLFFEEQRLDRQTRQAKALRDELRIAGDASGDPRERDIGREIDEARELIDEAKAGLLDLIDAYEAKTYVFRFVSIGPRWKKLKEAHAPTKEQSKEARENREIPPEFRDEDEFWPEAISASLAHIRKAVDDEGAWQPVDWTPEQYAANTATWNEAQHKDLREGCRAANERGNSMPGKDSSFARSLSSAAKPASPPPSASPAPSSTGGA